MAVQMMLGCYSMGMQQDTLVDCIQVSGVTNWFTYVFSPHYRGLLALGAVSKDIVKTALREQLSLS